MLYDSVLLVLLDKNDLHPAHNLSISGAFHSTWHVEDAQGMFTETLGCEVLWARTTVSSLSSWVCFVSIS